MTTSRSHRLSVARELATWGAELPALRVRIAEALAKSSVPGRQKIELESMARGITMLFNAIGEMPGPDEADAIVYDRLLKRTDRLRELIATLTAALDGVAALPSNEVRQRPTVRDWRTSSHVDRPKS
jgi:hypothetical protein